MSRTNGNAPPGRVPLPMSVWRRKAKELGFELRVDHEPEEFAVYILLKPKTRKAKTAIDRALGDDCEFITVKTIYDKNSAEMKARGIDPPPREDKDEAIAISLDDTAAYALTMAEKALQGEGT